MKAGDQPCHRELCPSGLLKESPPAGRSPRASQLWARPPSTSGPRQLCLALSACTHTHTHTRSQSHSHSHLHSHSHSHSHSHHHSQHSLTHTIWTQMSRPPPEGVWGKAHPSLGPTPAVCPGSCGSLPRPRWGPCLPHGASSSGSEGTGWHHLPSHQSQGHPTDLMALIQHMSLLLGDRLGAGIVGPKASMWLRGHGAGPWPAFPGW